MKIALSVLKKGKDEQKVISSNQKMLELETCTVEGLVPWCLAKPLKMVLPGLLRTLTGIPLLSRGPASTIEKRYLCLTSAPDPASVIFYLAFLSLAL